MSIRLLFVGLLGLALFAAKAPAGENDSCPAQKCGREKDGAYPQKKTDKEREMESKLHTAVTLNFTDAPLRQVIDDLRASYGVNIYVDQLALDQEGVSMERPVSVKLENVSLKSALNLTLKQVHLTYIIKDEVLQVTSESVARGKMQRVTYQVADLVVPIPKSSGPLALQTGGGFSSDGNALIHKSDATQTREEQLIKLITKTVEPRSWSDLGGAGTIDYHSPTMSLVVYQTPDGQEQILDVLNSLRRLQNQQVALEVRFISVDETIADRLSTEFTGKEAIKLIAASDSPLRMSLLNDAERSRLLEVVQGDRRTSVMQPPKPTMFSGQSWTWETGEKKTFVTGVDCRLMSNGSQIFQPIMEDFAVGTRMTARPFISPDRRSVSLGLEVRMNKLDDPEADMIPITLPHGPEADGEQTPAIQLVQRPRISSFGLDNTITIPDGGTALISGWKREHGVRTENALPVLSDIPYIGELFKNVSYTREKECVFMMVTPRIIVVEEQEEKAPTE